MKTTNSVSFFSGKATSKKNENEEDLVQTNLEIQKTFGTNEDLVMTSVVTQFGLTNLIDSKKTERKKTYAKFFDLDIFSVQDSFYLKKVPVNTVWASHVISKSSLSLLKSQHRGLQFENLTPHQISQLDFFLQNYTHK